VHYLFEPGTFVPVAQAIRHATIRLISQPTYQGRYSRKEDPLWTYKPTAQPIDVLAWYQCDHLGTPQELTDQNGGTAWSAQYKAWGEAHEQRSDFAQQVGLKNPIRFQGQYHDPETDLHYNRHRYYDPGVGRFISKDPIGYQGGLNLYHYAANPVFFIDPLGLAGHLVTAQTAGQDVLARGVHVNVNGPGLPPKGGHIELKPDPKGTHVILEPADKATRNMNGVQWRKACKCVGSYLDESRNVDRMAKASEAGISANPNSGRVPELSKVGNILRNHHRDGTNPVSK
jgi:RHS repeat-associated protein